MLDLTYLDNDPTTDPAELTALFTAVGWNKAVSVPPKRRLGCWRIPGSLSSRSS